MFMQKELVILGAGESGVGAALLAKSKDIPVFVSDSGTIAAHYKDELFNNNITFEEGSHNRDRILKAGEVIKSPGIPDSSPLIKDLESEAISVISDIEFAGRYTNAHIIGVTGSNGKTTTAMWLHHVLMGAGIDVVLSGNIGVSPCRILSQRDPSVFVMELSSFQLDRMYNFKVDTAIITNVTPDHLDRYDYEFNNYLHSKLRILQNQSKDDVFIWWKGDQAVNKALNAIQVEARCLPFSEDASSCAHIEEDYLVVNSSGKYLKLRLRDISLSGRHNLYNAMAVALASLEVGADVEAVIDGLSTFKGVKHRLESCREVEGVLYINDSKATNVNSTWYALESMNRPVIWIAGGTDKGNDYEELFSIAAKKVKALICLGLDNNKLIESFKSVIPVIKSTSSMKVALGTAQVLAHEGDVVLLSPACASFDLFKNYEHRGDMFRKMVEEI